MNAKKIIALSDEQITRIRELSTQKDEIEQEINQILGKQPRRPRQKKLKLEA